MIIAESLYYNAPVSEIEVTDVTSGIDIVVGYRQTTDGEIDYNYPVDIFNLNGGRVAADVSNLSIDIYIVRQGAKNQKVAVK